MKRENYTFLKSAKLKEQKTECSPIALSIDWIL